VWWKILPASVTTANRPRVNAVHTPVVQLLLSSSHVCPAALPRCYLAAAAVSELFGISAASSSQPSLWLRIHLRRLSGLQLWTVVRYAAGRGASADSVRQLGLAAWLSDNTTSCTAASMPCQVGRHGRRWLLGRQLA
jgi:hypothetical protein